MYTAVDVCLGYDDHDDDDGDDDDYDDGCGIFVCVVDNMLVLTAD